MQLLVFLCHLISIFKLYAETVLICFNVNFIINVNEVMQNLTELSLSLHPVDCCKLIHR